MFMYDSMEAFFPRKFSEISSGFYLLSFFNEHKTQLRFWCAADATVQLNS